MSIAAASLPSLPLPLRLRPTWYLLVALLLTTADLLVAEDARRLPHASAADGWQPTASIAAPEAHQAAAADDRYVYAINNTTVARYDRHSGQRLAVSSGEATHLNSGWYHDGKLYCAHSNFPKKPERSQIMVVDLESMQLSVFQDFGQSEFGSLTWAVIHDGHWWCNFAHYGQDNHRTVLVKYDQQWQPLTRWNYPPSVVQDLGRHSISGAIWMDGVLLATGHDKRVLYRLKLPHDGDVLEHIDTVNAPFTGQGIAVDPVTGGLVGIDRGKREILFAMPK